MTRLLILASMLFASAVFAQVEIPHVHENGDVIDADEINQNLDIVAKAVPPRDCSKDQVIKWDGSAWVCTSEIMHHLEFLEERLPPVDCSYDQIIKSSGGSAWLCASKSIVQQNNCTGEGSAACFAACAEYTTVVSGGCTVMASDGPLWEYQSTPKSDLSGWLCAASVNTGAVTVSASAICQ